MSRADPTKKKKKGFEIDIQVQISECKRIVGFYPHRDCADYAIFHSGRAWMVTNWILFELIAAHADLLLVIDYDV